MSFPSFWLRLFHTSVLPKLYALRAEAGMQKKVSPDSPGASLDPVGGKEGSGHHHRVLCSSLEGSEDPCPTSLTLLTSVFDSRATRGIALVVGKGSHAACDHGASGQQVGRTAAPFPTRQGTGSLSNFWALSALQHCLLEVSPSLTPMFRLQSPPLSSIHFSP